FALVAAGAGASGWMVFWPTVFTAGFEDDARAGRMSAGTGGTFDSGVPAAPACARTSAALAGGRRRRGAAAAGVAGVASGRSLDAAGALGGTASGDGGSGFFLRAIVGSATSFTNAGSVAAGRDNPGHSGENRRVRPHPAAPPYAPS